jgi:hypothetical protein
MEEISLCPNFPVPIGVVAIFGTHSVSITLIFDSIYAKVRTLKDLLEVWMFWRWRRNQDPEESDDMTYRDSRSTLTSTEQFSTRTMSVVAPSDLSTSTISITSRVMEVESRI